MSSHATERDLLAKYVNNTSTQTNKSSTKSSSSSPQYDPVNKTYISGKTDSYTIEKNLLSNYTAEKTEERVATISAWVDRYNNLVNDSKDKSLSHLRESVDSLIKDYDEIKDYADKLGLPNSQRLLQTLQESKDYYSTFNSEEEFSEAKKITEYLAKYEGKDSKELESLLGDVSDEAEKAWLTDYQRYMDFTEKQNLDTDAYSKAIELLESKMNEYDSLSRWNQDAQGIARMEAIREKYGTLEEMGQELDQQRAYLREAKRIQEKEAGRERFDAIREREDFDQFSTFDERNQEFGYQYINADAEGRADLTQKYGQVAEQQAYNSFDSLSEEEKEVYNYLMNTGDRQGAVDYLKYIQEDLAYSKAEEAMKVFEDRKALEYVFGIEAGLDQFRSGAQGFGNLVAGRDEYVPASYTQQLSGMIREDLGDGRVKLPDVLGGATVGQMVYDAITTSANMAPSILTSIGLSILNPAVGQAAGSALMGMGAAGNAYQEAINIGFDKDQARGYGLLVGASEIVMEKVLGGISALGGNVLGKYFTSNLSNADTALKAIAKNLGGSMLSEFSEEYLQEVLDPVFRNLTLGTHEDVKIISSEAIYSGILGALSAFMMEGPSSTAKELATQSTGKRLQESGITAQRLKELGQTFSADTVAYQLASKVNENTGAYTMGRLFNEIGATLTEQNVNEITNALIQEGIPGELARKNAEIMAMVVDGATLSDKFVAAIENDKVLARAMRTTIVDPNATWFQRTQGYKETLMALAREKASSNTSRAKQSPAGQENVPTSDKVDAKNKTAPEADSGADTAAPKVEKITTNKDDQVTVKLEDGSEMDSTEAGIDPEDGVIIETIAKIGGISVGDANYILNILKAAPGANPQVSALGAKEAYMYGFYGMPEAHMAERGVFAYSLTKAQRDMIYAAGRNARQAKVDAKQAAVAKNNQADSKKVGKVHFDGDRASLTKRQSASLTAMEKIADVMGVQIHVFESKVGDNGKRIGANGWYDPTDNSIHIDLHAGANGEGTMLFTLAHELTHHIRKWSPAKFKVLSDFLMQEYGKKGKDVDGMIREQMKKASRNGRTISYDTAYEEFVADSMELMLTDGNVMKRLEKLKAKDKDLWHQIKRFIDDLAAKIRSVYKGMAPDSEEGRYVAEMGKAVYRLQELLADALYDASVNYGGIQINEAVNNDAVAEKATPVQKAAAEKTVVQETKVAPKETAPVATVAAEEVVEPEVRQESWEERAARYEADRQTMPKKLKMAYESHLKTGFGAAPKFEKKALRDPKSIAWIKERGLDTDGGFDLYDSIETGRYTIPGTARYAESTKQEKVQEETVVEPVAEKEAVAEDTAVPEVRQEEPVQESADEAVAEEADVTVAETVSEEAASEETRKEKKEDLTEQALLQQIQNAEAEEARLKSETYSKEVQKRLWDNFENIRYLRRELEKHRYGIEHGISDATELDISFQIHEIERVKGLKGQFITAVLNDLKDDLRRYIRARETGKEVNAWLRYAPDITPEHKKFFKETQVTVMGADGKKPALVSQGTIPGQFAAAGNASLTLYTDRYDAFGAAGQEKGFVNITNAYIVDAQYRELGKLDLDAIIRKAQEEKVVRLDGVIIKNVNDETGKGAANVYIAFEANRFRTVDEVTYSAGYQAAENVDPDIKLSDRDYTYNSLVSKPDMAVTAVDDVIPSNRADVVALAKKNAAKVGKFDPKTGSVSVHVDDINVDVVLSTDGLKHGLRRTKNPKNDANYIVTVKAGEIIKNSIKINEANPKKDSATGAYVLIGVASNASGDMYIVRSIVNQFKNELASMDVLYAINAKKELAALYAPRSAAKPLSVTSSTISIAELLDHVNQYFPDILPEDVLKHYGYDVRPEGDFGENVLYSDRDTDSVSNRSLLLNALPNAETDLERKKIGEYQDLVAQINAEEQKLQELNQQIREELNQKKVKELRIKEKQTLNRMEILDKKILRKEAELKTVLERERKMAYLRGDQKRKNSYEEHRINQEVEQLRIAREYRAIREELRGYQDDTKVMEKEFIRIVKAFEKQNEQNRTKSGKDAKTIADLRDQLKQEAAKHKEEKATWEKEFGKLLKEYEAYGRKIDQLEAQVQHQRQSAKKNVDGRKRTILRNKIRKDIRELDKILKHGNKKRNVKLGMQDMVAEAIRSGEVLFADVDSDIDMVMAGMLTDMSAEEQRLYEDAKRRIGLLNPNGDKTAEEIQDLLKQHPKNELQKVLDKLHHAFERERIRINNTQASEAFQSLVDTYEALKESNDQYISMAFNENVLDHLKRLKRKTEGTLVKDMDQKQLQALHDGYKMIMKTIREANKAFVDGRSIQADAEQMVAELEKVKKPDGKVAIALQNVFNSVGWNYEKFYYALERINSPTLKRLFGNLAESENITMRDVQEAKEFQANAVKKYHYNDWDIDKKIDHTFVDNNGKTFQLTLGEMLSLYAYSRREGADKHIEVGGFTFGKKALTDPKPADTYKLTADQMVKITSMLTPEQKAFAEAMQKFLTEVMGEKGNEVTMKLYGIKLYTEENYWPLHIAGEYKVKAQESQAQAVEGFKTMANAGFTHARNMDSTAPIVLEGFMDVWVDHVNEMSRYHGAVPALEDIRRVMNYSVYSEASSESVSVTAALTNAYGKNAVEYFDSLYREANSGAVREKMVTVPAKALSLFRKGAVAYSLSVIIQQPASIHRAKMLVDSKYFGKHGMFTLTSGTLRILNRSKWNASYAEMMKYAPGVTMAKEIGGFDTSTGSSIRRYLLDTEKTAKQEWKHGTAKQKAGAVLGIVDDNIIANLPNVADKIAWIEMWEACKREVHSKNHNLSPVTEEFMQKVGERFTEVVRATQVYDSMFSKSPMLNSKYTFVQSLVSFMNEPNTVANMAEDAVRKFAQGERRQAVKTAGALVTSIVSTNVLKSIIYAMRDDDEDETFWEKYVSAFAGNLINDFNPANYIPGARDYISIKQGYDVERTDMAIIADVVKAAQALKDLANKDISDMTEKELEKHDKKLTDAQWRMAETLAVFAGIPLKNIRRDVLAIANTVKTNKLDKNRESTDLSVRLAIQEALQGSEFGANKLYEAIVSGDKELERRIRSEYDKENEYRSAVRKALRENDQRITEAAKAWNSNDLETYQRIADEIIAEGKFSKTDVREAINTKANSLDKTEKEPTPEKEKGLFNADKFAVAISQDNADMADAIREDIIETAKINGSDAENAEKSFNSSAKSALKKLYLEQGVTAEQAEKALRDYCDVGSSEAEQLIRDWDFEAKYDKSFSEMFNEYEKGNVTEKDIRSAMKEIGMKEYEIAEKLRTTQENKAFQNKFKMTFSEARDLYMDGQLNKSKMREMLIYDGKTQMQADDTLREWDVAKKFDIPYDKLDDAYKYGDISRQQLYSAMISVGETPKKAEEAMACYDWLKARVKEHPDLQISDARKFVTSISDTCDEAEDYTLTDYGISVNTYKQYKTVIADAHGVDEDGDGDTDSGTLRESKFNIINSMSLSKSQKDALAMISYSMKSIRRYAPWH